MTRNVFRRSLQRINKCEEQRYDSRNEKSVYQSAEIRSLLANDDCQHDRIACSNYYDVWTLDFDATQTSSYYSQWSVSEERVSEAKMKIEIFTMIFIS